MKKVAAFIASGSGMGADAAKHLLRNLYNLQIIIKNFFFIYCAIRIL